MKVRDIMTTPAVTVRQDAQFSDVVDQLLEHNISGAPVVDVSGHLVGVVTDADLVSHEAYGSARRRPLGLVAEYLRGHDPQWVRKASGHTAGELMTAAPDTTTPDEDVSTVARRMLEHRHKRLPVVDSAGRVVGVVARCDLLRPFHRDDADITADINKLLGDFLQVPEGHAVEASVVDGMVSLHGTTQQPSDITIIEAAVARVPGVVVVRKDLTARGPEPTTPTQQS